MAYDPDRYKITRTTRWTTDVAGIGPGGVEYRLLAWPMDPSMATLEKREPGESVWNMAMPPSKLDGFCAVRAGDKTWQVCRSTGGGTPQMDWQPVAVTIEDEHGNAHAELLIIRSVIEIGAGMGFLREV